jgi:hypothetical protein
MSKFKVGDKVVRKPRKDNSTFEMYQGVFDYYTITSISTGGHWLQIDNFTDRGKDLHPWYAPNFEPYQEPEDELPPVPDSVMYFNSVRDEGNDQHLVVEMTNKHYGWDKADDAHVGLRVVPRTSWEQACTIGVNLTPDAALQLAHDLRRMAMEIKRKEKA